MVSFRWRRSRTAAWAASIALAACLECPATSAQDTQAQESAARGVIVVGIVSNGARTDHHWEYQVTPLTGSILMVKDRTIPHRSAGPPPYAEPSALRLAEAGDIQTCLRCPAVTSSDGRCVARCHDLQKPDHSPGDDVVVVTSAESSTVLSRWNHKGRMIRGLAWSPDSKSVAVLNESEHYSKSPVGVISGLAGHPIPHSSVFLDIVDVRTGSVAEYLLRADVVYAYPRILSWND